MCAHVTLCLCGSCLALAEAPGLGPEDMALGTSGQCDDLRSCASSRLAPPPPFFKRAPATPGTMLAHAP